MCDSLYGCLLTRCHCSSIVLTANDFTPSYRIRPELISNNHGKFIYTATVITSVNAGLSQSAHGIYMAMMIILEWSSEYWLEDTHSLLLGNMVGVYEVWNYCCLLVQDQEIQPNDEISTWKKLEKWASALTKLIVNFSSLRKWVSLNA